LNDLQRVLRQASMNVVPLDDEKHRLHSLATRVLSSTRTAAKAHRLVRDVILGGSFAKGTWLPSDVDIDIFVRINPRASERTFERIGLAIGERATEGYPRGKKYAQHPYTEAMVDGVKVNIVPCYDVKPNQWKSAADRSPYHLEIVERMSGDQKLQVRLLKKFMKGVGVYGAEIESQGFSGYAAEVLVIREGSFEGALKYFADFKPHNENEYFHLADPVDNERDLARAISPEKIARLTLASRSFLRSPSVSYFGGFHRRKRPQLRRYLIAVVFSHAPLSEDTLWGELKKTLKHVEGHLEAGGFRIARAAAVSNSRDSSAFLFLPEVESLPGMELRIGPPVDKRTETEQFLSKNRNRARLIWVGEDARARLMQRRRNTRLVDLLEETTQDIRRVGASREMAAGIARSGKVITWAKLSKLLPSKAWLREGVDEIVSDTIGTSPA